MPEGQDVQSGCALGHPSPSAAPNVCLVEVHLEEVETGAVLMAMTRAKSLGQLLVIPL